jgi:DNA-directed RNA polymerase subunit M/transcription elongation factor TFIIS
MTVTEFEDEGRVMEQFVNPARCCPECSSKQYVFRGRKKIAAEADQPAAVETRYMCKECGHAWRERVAVNRD